MATKRGEKRNIDDNERISRRNTEKSSEAEKRIRLSDDNVEVNKKSIEKLLRTNSQIISKLEVLITGQKNLETRLSGIEKKLNDDNKNNNTIDPEYIKLVQQHRSIRGTFTSRVKDVMYSVFEATGHKLPSINTQVSPSKIQEWKSKPEVKRCYNNLFKKVKDGQPTTYMSLIIDKLRKENKNPSKTQIAYAISICETYLNPNNQNIQMSESIMKSKIINNLQKLENRDKFTHSDDDSHDGNDVDNGGDGAADDGAGAADDGATNDGRPNDSAANDSAANNGAANDSIADDDILSSDSYNTEEEGRYVNSLLENYGLHRK
ncbi:hypothetical protein RclHR1_21950002 [Rhizophagus clarus]|uniref:Uncharacterized protein n=2 Tax=Rhizophagus clarus TaxID=94130 RepID=A0A2Z6R6V1_9GLOM|nr:hypothetical protein RclHR1_21950002 [Rhizophagus clarus]GES75711.1 hypothetical protein GLOIN_2v1883439 [Rhizophagus clarus]GES77543.1 hypothetical protein GLOIN_2v1883439 [Rhizophagus clarus]GES77691.1 hypothetical protein GLOIN_2v1883439 [Rhizophagus clarus]GES77962.1 hypothetical protein GLOIN_2v1883439 [Rhizophagus clarus]